MVKVLVNLLWSQEGFITCMRYACIIMIKSLLKRDQVLCVRRDWLWVISTLGLFYLSNVRKSIREIGHRLSAKSPLTTGTQSHPCPR